MESKTTTIKIEKQTKARLDKLKEHPRETYNDTIKKTLHLLNILRRNPDYGNRILSKIDQRIKSKNQIYQSIPKGKVKSLEKKEVTPPNKIN